MSAVRTPVLRDRQIAGYVRPGLPGSCDVLCALRGKVLGMPHCWTVWPSGQGSRGFGPRLEVGAGHRRRGRRRLFGTGSGRRLIAAHSDPNRKKITAALCSRQTRGGRRGQRHLLGSAMTLTQAPPASSPTMVTKSSANATTACEHDFTVPHLDYET